MFVANDSVDDNVNYVNECDNDRTGGGGCGENSRPYDWRDREESGGGEMEEKTTLPSG